MLLRKESHKAGLQNDFGFINKTNTNKRHAGSIFLAIYDYLPLANNQIVLSKKINQNNDIFELDIQHIAEGFYFVQLNNSVNTSTSKIVISH